MHPHPANPAHTLRTEQLVLGRQYDDTALPCPVPRRLRDVPLTPWARTDEAVERLLLALKWCELAGLPLRVSKHDSERHLPDAATARPRLPHGLVPLGGREIPVGALLDANPALARLAGFRCLWQARGEAEWDAWDRVVAWAEGGGGVRRFELPGGDGELDAGWELCVAAGVVGAPPRATLSHPRWGRRTFPLADVERAARPGLAPAQSLANRRFRLAGRDVRLRSSDIIRGTAEVTDGERTWAASLDACVAADDRLGPLLARVHADALARLIRWCEGQSSNELVLTSARRAVDRFLPLTRWELEDPRGLEAGQVRVFHPEHPFALDVWAWEVAAALARRPTAGERLVLDPVWWSPTARGARRPEPAWIVGWGAEGVALDDRSGSPPWIAPLSAILAHNPDLASLVFAAWPDAGAEVDDPDLGTVVRRLHAAGQPGLAHVAAAAEAPVPRCNTVEARQVLRELIARPELPLSRSFRDARGTPWSIRRLGEDGRFVVVAAVGDRRGLPGPTQAGGVLDGTLTAPVERALTPAQLAFAAPRLASELTGLQLASGRIADDGTARPFADRLHHQVTRLGAELLRRAAEPLPLGEGARAAQVWHEHLRANLDDLRRGRMIRVRCEAEAAGHQVGFGLALGDAGLARRSGDDRLVYDDGVRSRWTGDWSIAVVGGGDSYAPEPPGPRVADLAQLALERAAAAIAAAVTLDEVEVGVRDALVSLRAPPAPRVPASLLVVATQLDSGESVIAWTGAAHVWRHHRGLGTTQPITFDQSVDGFAAGLVQAGASPVEARCAALILAGPGEGPRDWEKLPDAELLRVAAGLVGGRSRRALRGAFGVDRVRLDDEHRRWLEIASGLARHRRLDLRAIERGAAMVFVERARLRPHERWIVATDGLSGPLAALDPGARRALAEPEPQRAAELLAAVAAANPEGADDAAIIVLDGWASRRFRPSHLRHGRVIHALTRDQRDLFDRGALEAWRTGPPARVVRGMFASLHDEADRATGRGALPTARDANFPAALLGWLAKRPHQPPQAAARPGATVDAIELYERDAQDMDALAVVLAALLRANAAAARLVRGLRWRGGQVAEALWVEVRGADGKLSVLDPRLPSSRAAIPADEAYESGAWVREGVLARPVHVRWERSADFRVHVAVPDPEAPYDTFEVLRTLSQGAPAGDGWLLRTEAAAPEATERPSPAAAPPPPAGGWLDLGD